MNPTQMDESYSAALRTRLVEQASTAAPARPRTRPRRGYRVWWGAGILAGTGALGAGAAAAGLLSMPGADTTQQLSTPVSATHTGSQTVPLGAAPEEATHVAVELSCLDAGTFTVEGDTSFSCTDTDALIRTSAQYDFPLAPGQDTLTAQAPGGTRWQLTTTYTQHTGTEWATNTNGDTYGVPNEAGTPDLVAVIATNGARGYVYADELTPQPSFSTPEKALAWQEDMAGKDVMIPVYESDGHTIIGQFQAGQW